MATAPDRLNDILAADVADNNANRNAIPFIDGDSINFHVTVKAPTGQHNLTGIAAIPDRVYRVMLLVKTTASNTFALEDDTPAGLVANFNDIDPNA